MSAIMCLLCGYQGDEHEVYSEDCTDRILARARRLEEALRDADEQWVVDSGNWRIKHAAVLADVNPPTVAGDKP